MAMEGEGVIRRVILDLTFFYAPNKRTEVTGMGKAVE